MRKRTSIYADISLFIVAIIWGSGFVITKNSLDHITPYYLLTFRFVVSSVLLGIIFFKRLKNATKEDWKAGFIIGLFLFGGFATQTVGIKYTTAGKQAFITATNVVMVPFIFWGISRRRPDIYEIVAAFLCFTGIGILSYEKGMGFGYGEFLTFICAILYAFQIAAIGYFSRKHDPIILSVIQIFVTAVFSTSFALIFETKPAYLPKTTIISLFYLAIFSTLIAFLVQNLAQKHTSSTHTAIILSLEAVFGGIMALIFLKEAFTVRFLIGCFAILISILTTETKWKFLEKDKT